LPEDYSGGFGGRDAVFDVTVTEVKAKRLPEPGDEFALEAAGFGTLAELREDIAGRLQEIESRTIEREFEDAVVDAAVAESEIEIPDRLVRARARELVDETLSALARQGISREAYLRISGKDEETLAREAEPEAAMALRREAVLAAVARSERIEPSDQEVLEALAPTAERTGKTPEKLLERLRSGGRLERVREQVASRRAAELLVREATPISVEQAKARRKLWTPGRQAARGGSGQLWTPGS
jgi:trigger factor